MDDKRTLVADVNVVWRFELATPLRYFDHELKTLNFQRKTAGTMSLFIDEKNRIGEGSAMLTLIARMAGVPDMIIAEMDGDDYERLVEGFSAHFFPEKTTVGSGTSPQT